MMFLFLFLCFAFVGGLCFAERVLELVIGVLNQSAVKIFAFTAFNQSAVKNIRQSDAGRTGHNENRLKFKFIIVTIINDVSIDCRSRCLHNDYRQSIQEEERVKRYLV